MKIDELVPFYNKVFRIEELKNYFREPASTIAVQLSRLCKSGKLIRLKKNRYTFPNFYPSAPMIAQQMVQPSYHSVEWVLSQNGIIPEGVAAYTLVTSQKTQSYQNVFGTFRYQHLSPDLFFGVQQRVDGALVASPEKALLDYLYLNSAKFKPNFACFQAERFDELTTLNWVDINNWTEKYKMKKLTVLAKKLQEYAYSESYQQHR